MTVHQLRAFSSGLRTPIRLRMRRHILSRVDLLIFLLPAKNCVGIDTRATAQDVCGVSPVPY